MKPTRATIGSLLTALLVAAGVAALPPAARAATPYEAGPPKLSAGRIDALVFTRLRQLHIEPANLCSDAAFLRRVYLDVIGTLPTVDETRKFLADKSAHKRRVLIDRLLERDEFADYWSMKWSDTLRVRAEFPIKLWPKAAQAYRRWLREGIRENRPYDVMAREMLLATGSNFYVPQVNFLRAMQTKDARGLAQATALTFMGQRTEHWSSRQVDDLAVFFSQIAYKSTVEWKEEIVYLDPDKTGELPATATLPDGTVVELPRGGDARRVLADWLVSRRNPYFAQCAVNRIWYWLMGRGIVQEPDDFRPDNPPVNPELLAYLERELVTSGYDLKHIYRLILNSQTYQLASIPRSSDPRGAANFAWYPLRRLEAEVLIDALCQLTGTTEEYVSMVPEPFTYFPEGTRAVAIDDGNSTSAFLEMFGRPSRDSGLASERNDGHEANQRLHMLNSTHVQDKIANGPGLQRLFNAPTNTDAKLHEAVAAIYLTILSRYPMEGELRVVVDYARETKLSSRDVAIDLAWALINSEEFLHRH